MLVSKHIPLKTRASVNQLCYMGSIVGAMTERTDDVVERSDCRVLGCLAGVIWRDVVSGAELARCGLQL